MIGGSPIGAGGAVRPFYNRQPAAAPPPAIARTLIGTTTDFLDSTNISVAADIPAGALVLAAICYTNRFLVGTPLPSFQADGRAMALVQQFDFAADNRVNTFWLALGGTGISAGDTLSWIYGADTPTGVGAVAIYVTGLAVPAVDRNAGASGAGTDQDSGLTAVTTAANEFVWGIIGTNGRQADAVGAWQNGLTAGAAAGSVVVRALVKEGFAIVAAAGQYQAHVTGATSRTWAALCDTYKG